MDQPDSNTTVAELRKLVADFVAERRLVAISFTRMFDGSCNRAAELMEHFQWLTTDARASWGRIGKWPGGRRIVDVIGYSFAGQ
jgi:hypothetical protein